jgi:hypothetical protein
MRRSRATAWPVAVEPQNQTCASNPCSRNVTASAAPVEANVSSERASSGAHGGAGGASGAAGAVARIS